VPADQPINLHTCIEAFPIERFRELLGVPPGAYADGQDFRRKVIEPAMLEVNRLSDLHVDIDLRRKHARAAIHEVAVSWRKQEGDDLRASIQERDRSKVGRKARLRGQAETIEAGPLSRVVNEETARTFASLRATEYAARRDAEPTDVPPGILDAAK
jgi:plasmid replication initiation protein